jgi:hypothetical protein
MRNRMTIWFTGVAAVLILSSLAFVQAARSQQSGTADHPKKASGPAPSHDVSGTWTPLPTEGSLSQSGGVLAMPNDGKPEHQLPYTPYGLQVYKSHKPLEGIDSKAENLNVVDITDYNDPREKCEPLGFPRMNHYDVRQIQIFQNEFKVAMLYQYDKRYRVIWTDGRELPTLVEGGVHLGKGWGADSGHTREQRFYGYSVGKWTDDTTLVVDTVGTMPEDRVWLDPTGRPISDQIHVTETFHRVDNDHLDWTEEINDPKMYTKPWVTMRAHLALEDPHKDVMEMYCSPVEIQKYYETYGDVVSGKKP